MKDFNEFLKRVDASALIGQSVERFADMVNNQGPVAKGRLYDTDMPYYSAVFMALNLLERYHIWLHSDAEEN